MFSKYDVYTTVRSLYCYPDSDVLKNKLNIRDRDELKRAEEEITALKQYMLMESPIKGRFTKTQLMNIHRFLFEDICPFAGLIRREQISKGDQQGRYHVLSAASDRSGAGQGVCQVAHREDVARNGQETPDRAFVLYHVGIEYHSPLP